MLGCCSCTFLGGVILSFTVVVILAHWLWSRTYIPLKKKVILITGCDSGFGNLLARRLDAADSIVFATCLTEKAVEELKKQTSNRCHPFVLDVTNHEHIDNAYIEIKNYCTQHDTSLWAIVNNAGVGSGGYLESLPIPFIDQVLNVNLMGTIHMTQKFLPLIKGRKEILDKINHNKNNITTKWEYWKKIFFNSNNGGRIVNISSLAASLKGECLSIYSCSKSGILGFSNNLRLELVPHFGIWVSTIEPGCFKTNIIHQESFDKINQHIFSEKNKHILSVYGGEESLRDLALKSYDAVQKIASPHLIYVIDSIIHALSSNAPYRHYTVNMGTFLLKCFFYLPDLITDWAIYIIYGLIRFK